jgi:hypothetical protein
LTQKQPTPNARASYSVEELYKLLPSVYRQRDEANGKLLFGLLTVISEQVGFLEKDIQRLYENWFIETCDLWVVPYIGDLVGARMVASKVSSTANQRAFVANTISYRRRKGTIVVLEHLARDITGWGAKAVEFFQLLEATQNLNHLRHLNVRTPDLRDEDKLRLINTPFDSTAYMVDVRKINFGQGLYNIPNVGVFLWRIQAFPAVNVPACRHMDANKKTDGFHFNALGLDTQLFNNPTTERGTIQPAKETDLPNPISGLALKNHLQDYYSSFDADRSIRIRTENGNVPAKQIVVSDLTEWANPVIGVAVDPVLGRIVFSGASQPRTVHVDYYYGFAGEMGGGFYERPLTVLQNAQYFKVTQNDNGASHPIQDAYVAWDKQNSNAALIEIADSETYTEPLEFNLPPNRRLEIRAAQGKRPVISAPVTLSVFSDESSSTTLSQSQITFNGLLFDQGMKVESGDLGALNLLHCTLVPKPAELSLAVNGGNDDLLITLDHSISGRIDTYSQPSTTMGQSEAELSVVDSIVDGAGVSDAINCYAIRVDRSTVFGRVTTVLMNASNSIFTDVVTSRRRQRGCVRFCHFPLGSSVPRQYRCQPSVNEEASPEEKALSALKVKPRFTSKKYGKPGYAQLHKDISEEIFRGADDGNEMGVFNSLQHAVRLSNLKLNLDEYTRFGLETGVFYVT